MTSKELFKEAEEYENKCFDGENFIKEKQNELIIASRLIKQAYETREQEIKQAIENIFDNYKNELLLTYSDKPRKPDKNLINCIGAIAMFKNNLKQKLFKE